MPGDPWLVRKPLLMDLPFIFKVDYVPYSSIARKPPFLPLIFKGDIISNKFRKSVCDYRVQISLACIEVLHDIVLMLSARN